MDYLWAALMLLGIGYGIATGQAASLTGGMISAAKEAVTLCLAMAGVMGLWVGMMEIAQKSGLIARMTRALYPVLHFLFPNLPRGSRAEGAIASNMIANFLGLGWAATPAGLEAMEELALLEESRRSEGRPAAAKGYASAEMCTFLVVNISSLQLLPMTVIAYRSEYGSVDPTAVVGPGIAATMVSTLAAVLFCKIMSRRK